MHLSILPILLPLAGGDLNTPSPASLVQETPSNSIWDQFVHWLDEGDAYINLNYRYEYVDQDGVANQAHASTLRSVLGYKTGAWGGFTGQVEFEDVSVIGNEDLYATSGGGTRPVVADGKNTEVNQAFVDYKWTDTTKLRFGRQSINLDNLRFIGTVSWRQNYQNYDAFSANFDLAGIEGFYAWVNNVNRIVSAGAPGDNAAMDSHLLNLKKKFDGVGALTAYAYLLDYDFTPASSRDTLGARFAGEKDLESVKLSYALEFANQKDAGDNTADVDADYSLFEVGATRGGYTLKVAQETLGGDGASSFQTPLATLHAHNGWADKFLATPAAGLVDTFVSLGTKVGRFKPMLVYHQYESDSGSSDYGTELDAVVTWPVRENVTMGIKAASYSADSFATDTTKAWFWVSVSI